MGGDTLAMLIFLAVPLFAFLDRFWGGPVAFKGKKAAMLAAAVGGGFLLAGGTGALFGLVWFIWRSIPFFNGSAAPLSDSEMASTIIRHAPIVLPAMLIAYWRDMSIVQTTAWFAGFAVAAVCLAFAYGHAVFEAMKAGEPIGKQNVLVEIVRGAAYGAALVAAVTLA